MAASRPPNRDAFEAYFKRADLDQDGRITGPEAVAFFKGSNLPQTVLAQIWKHSDQNNSGFLGRPEFYNALKLVTVAQSGRELTPDIVKAALFGPAAAKIPAPQINPVLGSATLTSSSVARRPQSGSTLLASTHIGVAAPIGSQDSGPRGISPGLGVNQQLLSPSNSHLVRLPQGTPATLYPIHGVNQARPGTTNFSGLPQISNTSNISTDWPGMNSLVSVGVTSQGSVQGILSSAEQDDMRLSAAGTTPGLVPKLSTPSAVETLLSTNVLNVKDSKAFDVSGNGFSSDYAFGGDAFSVTPQVKQDGISPAFSSGSTLTSGITSVTAVSQTPKVGALDSRQSTFILPLGGKQPPEAQPMVQKHPLDSIQNAATTPSASKLSEQIPNPVSQPQLTWPRISQTDIQKYTKVFVEVDKDKDGKITGEQARNLFLSWRLPREVLKQVWDLSDQDNDSMLSFREFCIALYLMERYREGRPLPALLPDVLRFDETLLQATGLSSASFGDPIWRPSPGLSQQGVPGSRPSVSITGVRPPMQSTIPFQVDGASHSSQQRLMTHFTGNLVNQQNKGQAFDEATDGQKKPTEVVKNILDSKEKIEYYRTKMQELVLYKSRCDNKLNEITERASGDKQEVESLAKKYEEKYKQVADVASKLTVEDATFRDIQGRKSELQNAIINMEKGGSSDGLLQVRADRIQSDLEELVKALHSRCKHHGLDIKSKATIELPFGWQPGIQEGVIDWDEDWDKFDDEGFSVAKDLYVEVENDVVPSDSKAPSVWSDITSTDGVSPVASISHPYNTDEKLSSAGGQITESESVYDHSEYGSVRSPPGSPRRSGFGTPSQEFPATNFDRHDISPRGKDNDSNGDGESPFDANDDVDSVWGFSAKEDGGDHTFGDFNRFDSFSSTHDTIFSPKRGTHTRFDSISSSSINDFDDTADPPFGAATFTSFDSLHSPKNNSDNWRSF